MRRLILPVVIAAVIAGGLGFYVGTRYPAGTVSGTYLYGGTGSSVRSNHGNSGGVGAVTGSIVSEDAQGVIIKLPNGNTQIVFVSTTTPVLKSVQGSISDLSVGQNVVISGTTNPDGSLTAEDVRVRPAGTSTPFVRYQQSQSRSSQSQ